ncbi:hypothetical protein WJX72_001215 [[Myrmecia] bisecta]|uniref:Nuclear pore complex protein n=1 Tax=[Myrmecia] bisecta TaxID=41462 RepID=A0AAW1PZF3_9CHLO
MDSRGQAAADAAAPPSFWQADEHMETAAHGARWTGRPLRLHEEGAEPGFSNPLYSSPSLLPTPQREGFQQQANPIWSPSVPGSPDYDAPPVHSLAAPAPAAGLARSAALHQQVELDFGATIEELMMGQLDSAAAVRDLAAICMTRATELREQARSQQHRGNRYIHLRSLADSLEAEAATWQLMLHLYGNKAMDYPGGNGGLRLTDCGGKASVRQRVADIVGQDEALNRVARVVTWLEDLAGAALDREEAASVRDGRFRSRFAAQDGVWKETRSRLDQERMLAQSAPAGRRRTADDSLVTELDPDAPTRQQRSLAEDNVKDEERLLKALWRLLRAGRLSQARQLCRDVGQPWRAASFGGAGSTGPVPLGQAAEETDGCSEEEQAEDIAAEVDAGDGVLRMLWRWSCYQISEQSAAAMEATGARCSKCLGVDSVLGQDSPGGEVSLELLMTASSSEGGAIVREGLSAAQPKGWPLPRLVDQLPTSFEEVFGLVERSHSEGNKTPTELQQRAVQMDLILGEGHFTHLLKELLLGWVAMGSQPQPEGPPAEAPSEGIPPGVLRFAAHVGIALCALDLVPPAWDDQARGRFHVIQESMNLLLQMYLMHLIHSGMHMLVPLYSCHLRRDVRHQVYAALLDLLTRAHDPDACNDAFARGVLWFGRWFAKGQGDVDALEMRIIAGQFAEQSRWVTRNGPLYRAEATRWLCFSPDTADLAYTHANQLLREFALGGPGCWVAAEQLLAVLQTSLDVQAGLRKDPEEWMRDNGATEADALQMQEIRCWQSYFANARAYSDWSTLYERLIAQRSVQPSASDVGLVRSKGVELLDSLLTFVREARLEVVALGQEFEQLQEPQTFSVIAALAEEPSARSAPVLAGEAYPGLPADGAGQYAEVLQTALSAALASSGRPELQNVHAEVQAVRDEASTSGDLLRITVVSTSSEMQDVAQLLALAFKGALPSAEPSGAQRATPGPLVVVNMEGAVVIQAMLCRALCYPSILLRCAELRQALVELGESESVGADVVALVAGGDGSTGFRGLADYFAQAQLQQLLEAERRTGLAALRAREAASGQQ